MRTALSGTASCEGVASGAGPATNMDPLSNFATSSVSRATDGTMTSAPEPLAFGLHPRRGGVFEGGAELTRGSTITYSPSGGWPFFGSGLAVVNLWGELRLAPGVSGTTTYMSPSASTLLLKRPVDDFFGGPSTGSVSMIRRTR